MPTEVFTEAVKNLLEQRREKFHNILIKGPANTGKTFLLNPLNTVYKSYTNPATSTFAWVGAEKAEVIFLNDFRWNSQIIQWHDLLLMLEDHIFQKILNFTTPPQSTISYM